jgi:hypothetical protein
MSVVVNVVGRYSDKEITKAISDLDKLKRKSDETAKGTTSSFSLAGKANKAMAAGIVAAGSLAAEGIQMLADKAIEFAKKSVEAYSDLGSEVRSVQRVLGGTPEFASHLVAAWKMSGIASDVASTAMARMEKHIFANDKAWKALGITSRDSHGKMLTMEQLLPKIADKFKSLPAGVDKTALAMGLFGSRGGGLAMLTFLNKGSAGMKAMSEESDKLGTTLSGKDLAATLAATMAKRKLGEAVEGAQVKFAKGFYPALAQGINFMADTVIPTVQNFATGLMQALQPAIDTVTQAWNGGLRQALIDAWPWLQKIVGFVAGAWAVSLQVFAVGVTKIAQGFVWVVNNLGSSIVSMVNQSITAFIAVATAYNDTIGKITGTTIDTKAYIHWNNLGSGGGGGTAGEFGYQAGTNGQVPKYTPTPTASKTTPYVPPATPAAKKAGSAGGGKKSAPVQAAKKTMADIMAEALSGAQKVLDNFHARGQAVLDFIKTIKDSVVSFGSVTAFQSRGNLEFANSANVIGQMQERVNTAKAFVQDVKALRKLGLNNGSLQEIISAGPVAGEQIAKALLQGGLASVKQVNSLESQLALAGSQLGDQGALSQYGKDGAQARGMVQTNIKIEKGALAFSFGAGMTAAEKVEMTKAVDKAFDALVAKLTREIKAGAKK